MKKQVNELMACGNQEVWVTRTCDSWIGTKVICREG